MEEITIVDNCNIVNSVIIVNHNHRLGEYGMKEGLESTLVHVRKKVRIGANVVFFKGVSIGNGDIIIVIGYASSVHIV